MNVMHEQVNHLKFGTGTITAQDSSTVTVKFSKEYGSKKFLYPSAFKLFLDLCDPSIKELQLIQTLAETERNKRLAEEEKQHTLLEQKAASKKKAPVKKRLLKKSSTEKKETVAKQDI